MKRSEWWPGRSSWYPMGLVLLIGMVGCGGESSALPGEDVLAGMEPGYGMQAVLNSVPEGPGVDEGPNINHGYRLDRYFLGGRSVEVLWLRPDSEQPLQELERSQVNPVIFVDQTLDGWGWEHFEARYEDWRITDRTVPEAEPERPRMEYDDPPVQPDTL